MGDEYVSTLKAGMESGWIDVYENENKRSGAYSWGAYGTHPYVLLNYADNLDSVLRWLMRWDMRCIHTIQMSIRASPTQDT